MSKKILLLVFCFAVTNAKSQNHEAVTTSISQINQILTQASLQTKSIKRYDYIAVNNGELIVTDSVFMSGYDKKFELYLYKKHVMLKDITDVVFEKKIAAYWCRIVLKPNASFKYSYNGNEETSSEGIYFILEKSFGKGEGPDLLKETFRKLLIASGLNPTF